MGVIKIVDRITVAPRDPVAAYVVAEGLGIIEMRTDQGASQPFRPERRRNFPSPPPGQ